MEVALSGTGRIGRLFLRKVFIENSPVVKVTTINTSASPALLAHLLQYDTVHGYWAAEITEWEQGIVVNGQPIRLVSQRSPELLDWQERGSPLVIDATGKFNNRQGAQQHIAAGARAVLITAPGPDLDLTVVMGVNEGQYDPEQHQLVSAASCTTNCLVPVLDIMDRAFGIEQGWMTTVHAYTNDQNHLDNSHADLRRARSCTQSIIPASTGVRKALSGVLPHLADRVQGQAVRVPTADVSLLDLQLQLQKPVISVDKLQEVFREAASGAYRHYVGYNELPLVSADYIGNDKSATVDGLSFMVNRGQVKLMAWYDNEWAYACRVFDLAAYMIARMKGEDGGNKGQSSLLFQKLG
ncbi:type I glyceraldehyde-3-phosphate dehydrogenase [Paenibacillus sp. GCM10027626]|uniref:type I glyceraldehyde-3-phosphate dehydrogenase n=1 Tax=Paenibacillus sp. GCM10027626 TaxID=3273411 RepID=UPI0036444657